MPLDILSSIQSRGLADRTCRRRAIRGRRRSLGGGPAQSAVSDGNSNDAATQPDPLDRDGRMLDDLTRNSFDFCHGS